MVSFLRAAVSTDLSSLLSFRRKGVNEDMVRSKIVEYYSGSDSVNALSQREFSQVKINEQFFVKYYFAQLSVLLHIYDLCSH